MSLAKGYEVILNPGDVLFFPSFWWHAVQNLDITVGMDIAIIDPVGGFQRNSLLDISTILNPIAAFNMVKSLLLTPNLGAKLIYFKGYFEDTKEFEEYVQQFK